MIEIGSVSVNYYCLIVYVAKGKVGDVWKRLLFQILKTVFTIRDVALDKSVPTSLPLRRYLRHINR